MHRNKEVGFNRDQVLIIHDTWSLGRDGTTNLRKNLLTLAGVTDATVTGDIPTVGGNQYWQQGWFPDASLDARKAILMTTLRVDDHYVPTLGMQIVEGRNFDLAQFPTDSTVILLNEAAAGMLGVKDPLNLILYNHDDQFKLLTYHVVGVVKDFNCNSMHEKIHPLVMVVNTFNWSNMAFAYRTEISWWIFLVAGAVALAIALLTVSIQTVRAALANPIKSLRSE